MREQEGHKITSNVSFPDDPKFALGYHGVVRVIKSTCLDVAGLPSVRRLRRVKSEEFNHE